MVFSIIAFLISFLCMTIFIICTQIKAIYLITKLTTEIEKQERNYTQIGICCKKAKPLSQKIWYFNWKSKYKKLEDRVKIIQQCNRFILELRKCIVNKDFSGNKILSELNNIKCEDYISLEYELLQQLKDDFLQQEQKIVKQFQTQLNKIKTDLIFVSNDKLSIHNDILVEAEKFCSQSYNLRFNAYKGEIRAINQQIANIKLDYMKRDLQQKINKFKKYVDNKQIDEAKKLEIAIERQIETIYSPEQKKQFEEIKDKFEQQYKIGIPINEDRLYVGYNLPLDYINSDYAFVRFPVNGNIVWPLRRKRIALRGYKEEAFELSLQKYFSNQIEVLGDVNLLPQSGCRPYEPDIAIVDTTSGLNIRVDIEIDEPYDGCTRRPTHYIGCGDENRDAKLNNLGWIVVRFSERQVHEQQELCVTFVAKLINRLNPAFIIPQELISLPELYPQKRWSQLDAQKMAKNGEREQYLNHKFGDKARIEYTFEDTQLTINEANILTEVPLFIPPQIVSNIRNSTDTDSEYGINNNNCAYNEHNVFSRDSEIHFDADHHIYTYQGIQFKAVSNLISELFPLFDKSYWAERKAIERDVSSDLVLEEWDCKGARSREVGTFLHQQIENHFLNNMRNNYYHFKYNGEYVIADEFISIESEFQYFLNFLNYYNVQPFRTEWRIFDKSTKLAGTIDFICRNGNLYDIYDWKRSGRVFTDNQFQTGLGNLHHLQDTSFNHYCLQQNLYKYILEKNYNMNIGKMYLVVLHPSYSNYIIKEVPAMSDEIQYILEVMND